MKYKRFKIRPKRSKLWFWVYVYTNVRVLRKDMIAFEYRSEYTKLDHETYGCCNPYTRDVYDKGKIVRRHENIGIIRLSKNYISSDVVAHELVHAVFWMYRQEHGGKRELANFGKNCNSKEEEFAYLYGELFRSMTVQLYKFKFWK